MLLARPAAIFVLALLLASGAGAATRSQSATALAAPQKLHGFLLRANEPAQDTFTRTPSFAWQPVMGANRYEFQLGTSRAWASNAIWLSKDTTAPAISLQVSLPWITGEPHSLYAHVRAIAADGAPGPWSRPTGFSMTPKPVQPETTTPGLLRWEPVDGATGYEVWYLNNPNGLDRFFTTTNVADEREYYQDSQPTGSACWRVRALRVVDGEVANGVPRVSYGLWSPPACVSDRTKPAAGAALTAVEAISDTVSTGPAVRAHELMPAFVYSGDDGLTRRFRVYVSTDSSCVNVVFRSWIVEGPAYAPRWGWTLPDDGGKGEMADGTPVVANEALPTGASKGEIADGTPVVANEAPPTGASKGPPPIDLWDSDPPAGRYYWTVVPVDSENQDVELPQDACTTPQQVGSFGKTSQPVLASRGRVPYASGLSPRGRFLSATTSTPAFYGTPLVSWEPARAASAYDVQWSRKHYPFVAAAAPIRTYGTSATLPLKPGKWWYRVRGINLALPPGAQKMAWSPAVPVIVARPTFRVVKG